MQQPFAFAIMCGAKDIENRRRRLKLPLPVYIAVHASMKQHPSPELGSIEDVRERLKRQGHELPPLEALPRGALLGLMRVGACDPPAPQRTGWALPGCHRWRITEVRRLPKPLACLGKLGLWLVPPQYEDALRSLLEGHPTQDPVRYESVSKSQGEAHAGSASAARAAQAAEAQADSWLPRRRGRPPATSKQGQQHAHVAKRCRVLSPPEASSGARHRAPGQASSRECMWPSCSLCGGPPGNSTGSRGMPLCCVSCTAIISTQRGLAFKTGQFAWCHGFGPMWPVRIGAIGFDAENDPSPYWVQLFGECRGAWVDESRLLAWEAGCRLAANSPVSEAWRPRFSKALEDAIASLAVSVH